MATIKDREVSVSEGESAQSGPVEISVRLSEAKARLSELVDEVRKTAGGEVEIRKRDRPVAVLMGVDRYRRLRNLEDRVLRMELRHALRGRSRPLREVLKDLGLEV